MKKPLLLTVLSTVCVLASAGNLVVAVNDKDGKPVQDAVVVIVPANKTALPKTPLPTTATIAQEKMQFIPAISLLPVGAKVRFVNNDPWDHHVRSSPAGMGQFNSTNAGFELRLEGKSEGKPGKFSEVTLDKAGVLGATLLGCFIHGSMRGYVYASDSPWAAKTSAEGIVTFEDLPDGAAQVKVWQADQLVDVPLQATTIGAALAKNVFQLTVVPRKRRS
ncbi:MAG: plastocyanin [Polaromonas sp.]|nr:plastocyanin [Polaromonas sp.]